MKVRTRFAPSPTGFMHVGNLRAALYSYLVSARENGDFILRIEDTDQSRKVEGAVDFIYDTCKLCGLEFKEGPNNPGEFGPYTQSERLEIYKKYAHDLVKMGKAYYCFCSEERLDFLREKALKHKQAFMYDGHCRNLTKEEIEKKLSDGEEYVIRQIMPKTGVSEFDDIVFGHITVDNSILEDQILLKSDGYPTYNFANVIDDHLMNITHVTRGNEYLMSTPKYNLIYEAFGWEKPIYVHMPVVNGSDGKKLSKRNGDASFMDLYNDGYLPEAVINYLVLLGWSPNDKNEIFTLDELCKVFDPKRISKSPSIYDVKKLNWINEHYIKKLSDADLIKLCKPFLEEVYDLSEKSEDFVNELIKTFKNHISFGREIVSETKMFFEDEFVLDEECSEFLKSDESIEITLNTFRKEIENISEFNIENINIAINNTKEIAGTKGKMLYMPIRIKTTGCLHGPELANTIFLIGKDKVLERLNK